MNNFEKVKKFMQTFGQEVKSKPSFPNDKIIKLRYELIEEELSELRAAIKDKDITEVKPNVDAKPHRVYRLRCP